MDSTSIELPGSTIAGVEISSETIRVRLEPAYLVKTMTGSAERTRWWQNGVLVFEGAQIEEGRPLPPLPATCDGGDVAENVYTYRDMIPIPLDSRGRAHCALKVGEGLIRIDAAAVRLEMEGVPKYIEHLRPA